MKQLHLPRILNLGRRSRRVLLVVVAVVVAIGLVVGIVARARSERARAQARPAVCEVVGELYRAALNGPVAPDTDEEWIAKTEGIATRLSDLADPFGMSARAMRLAGEAQGRSPSSIRKAARGVGCSDSTFPPIPSAVFDSTPPGWAVAPVGSLALPAVVVLSGAQLPPESAVADNVRDASFATLAAAGVPIDKMPLIDPSQGRISWIDSSNFLTEQRTLIRFATDIDDSSSAVASIMDVAASFPEMQGASDLFVGTFTGHVYSHDLSVRIEVSVDPGEGDATGYIDIERRSIGFHTVTTPLALVSTVAYGAGPMTGANSTLQGWWLHLGTDPEDGSETDVRVLTLTIEQSIEPVMNSVAQSVGTFKVDGSHLFRRRFVDPTQPEFDWRFVGYGSTATKLFVFNTISHG